MKALGINGREEKLPEGGIVMAGTKRALLTGAGSQDGTYLAELLLDKGYEVFGISRRSSGDNLYRLKPPYSNVLSRTNYHIIYGDVTDYSSIERALFDVAPHEFYNLAAQSHVGFSFDAPIQTVEANGIGALNCLEAIRQYQNNTGKTVYSYFCGTSELMGSNYIIKDHPKFLNKEGQGKYQDETVELSANSPYGLGKWLSHRAVGLYRESYKMNCCSSIMYNHEAKIRSPEFVTRKITKWFGEFYNKYYLTNKTELVKNNDNLKLHLGWIDSARDWSHAKDIVRAMWMIVKNGANKDYVVGSGTARTVKDFLAAVFSPFGLDYNNFIFIDPECMRPREVEYLQADPTKIREELGWRPEISFDEMVKEMVDFDIELAKNGY